MKISKYKTNTHTNKLTYRGIPILHDKLLAKRHTRCLDVFYDWLWSDLHNLKCCALPCIVCMAVQVLKVTPRLSRMESLWCLFIAVNSYIALPKLPWISSFLKLPNLLSLSSDLSWKNTVFTKICWWCPSKVMLFRKALTSRCSRYLTIIFS